MTHSELKLPRRNRVDYLSAKDISEIAKQIGLRLTNWRLQYEAEEGFKNSLWLKVVDEYEHICLDLFVETNMLIK